MNKKKEFYGLNDLPLDAKIVKFPNGYALRGGTYTKVSSEFGRSQCRLNCIVCGSTIYAYVWSFYGGGKRCDNCNAVNTPGGGFLDMDKLLPEQIELIENHIKQYNQ